jgi:AhpD family alkylhydroperoxidase
MSRVELLSADRAPLLARSHYRDDGSASPITRALAQAPELLDVAMPFIGALFGPGAVDLRLKEVVVLRVSALNRCRYCVATHTVAAWDAGLTEAETAALRGAGEGLGERETALVEWCDALARTGEPVGEEAAARLAEHFADHEIVELALLAGATVMLNRFCTALELAPTEATVERLQAAGIEP